MIIVIEYQFKQEPFNDEDVLCKPDKDDDEDLYDDEDLANKNIKDPVMFDKFSEDIMKDYFCVPLTIMVEVLKDIDDDELKFEVERYRKELQVDFIWTKMITSNMDFSLLHMHLKLKIKFQKSKPCYL